MDTITAVTAMLIMVSLMMTLYFGNSPAATSGGRDSTRLTAAVAQLNQVNAQNQALRLQLASLEASPDRERLEADLANLQAQIRSQSSNLAQLQLRQAQQETEAQHKANELGVGEEHRQIAALQLQIEALHLTNHLAQDELEELNRKTTELEAKLEKSKRERAKLWLIPEADASGKQPLLVSVSATNLVCERFNRPESRQAFAADAAERQFGEVLRQAHPDRDYFVFYIRPSGIRQFQHYSTLAKQAGFNVGYDAVEEDRQILFSQPRLEP